MFKQFGGNTKADHFSLLSKPEKIFIEWLTPKIPVSIKSHHLTYTTILWSVSIILFGYLAQFDMMWLSGTCIMIFLQWLTDSLDGSVGRARNEGLVKWGYYMDHFLDYIFLCSILIGYSFFLHDFFNSLFFILAIAGGFMVNSFLSLAVTNRFKITYLGVGPTEIRLLFIIINILFITIGKTYMQPMLPYILAVSLLGLIIVVYKTQKEIWAIDMKSKNAT